jgi:lipopolysaccharide/colanic/teichoic acid biosynthesis glycosyltransferase
MSDATAVSPSPILIGADSVAVQPRPTAIDTSRPLAAAELRIATTLNRFAKRTLDLLVAVPALVLCIPLLLGLLVLVRLTSPGPALFRQSRPGRDGRLFRIFKLRTMQIDAEERLFADPVLYAEFQASGFKLPADRDPRITPVGRFLRRTSLDELPQILNVVGGSMSLVGPRPVLLDQAEELYGSDIGLYLAVKPGLTGLWQVSGRSNLSQDERAELDGRYVLDWSPGLDITLLMRTVPAVLSGNGAR